MSKQRIRIAVRALAVAGALSAATLGAQAQTVNVKLSSWVPAQHSLNPGLQAWGESLKRASGGTINPTLFPAEQLGKAFDHYDMARDGITDFAYVNPGYQPGRFPSSPAHRCPSCLPTANRVLPRSTTGTAATPPPR